MSSASSTSPTENGKKSPSSRTLHAIARALGLRPHELLAEADALAARSSDPLLVPSAPSGWFSSDEGLASPRGTAPRSPTSALRELADLLDDLAPDDVERVLDLARRLRR